MHQADTALALRISASIPPAAAARMLALIAEASDDPSRAGDGREAFAFIKSDPGDVSLKTCEDGAAKLALRRHIGLPAGLFADVAPKVLAAWRARAAMEAPSHLREHQDPVKLNAAGRLAVLPASGRTREHLHAEVGQVPPAVSQRAGQQPGQVVVDRVEHADLVPDEPAEQLDVPGFVHDLGGRVEPGVQVRHRLDDPGRDG